MHKFILTTIIAFWATNGLYAQEKDTAQEEPKIELKVIYEKTFDEPIVDVIFDTATVSIEEAKKIGWKEEAFKGLKIREKTKIIYPKVVITRKKEEGKAYYHYVGINRSYGTDDLRNIKFYNKMGGLLKVIDAGIFEEAVELLRSPNGRYFCIAKWPSEYNCDYRGGILYNSDGRKIWEIENYTPIAISDEGHAVAAYVDWDIPPAPGGKFYVYDNKGKLIKTVENPDSTHLVARFAKFSDDGEWAIVAFKRETYPPTHITLIKKTGEVIWERYFPECRVTAMGEQFMIIPGVGVGGIWNTQLEKGTGAFRNTEVFFIDWQGNLKWAVPLEMTGSLIINASMKNRKVYAVSGAGYVWCFNMDNGKIIWRHKEPWASEPEAKGRPKGVPTLRELEGKPLFQEMWLTENRVFIMGGYQGFSAPLFVFDSETGHLLKKIEFFSKRASLVIIDRNIAVIQGTKGKIEILREGGFK